MKVPVKPERYALCEGTRRQIVQGTDIARLRSLSVRDGGSAYLVEGCVLQVSPLPVQLAVQRGLPESQFLGWRPLWPAAGNTPDKETWEGVRGVKLGSAAADCFSWAAPQVGRN